MILVCLLCALPTNLENVFGALLGSGQSLQCSDTDTTSVEHILTEALADVICGVHRLHQPEFQTALEALAIGIQHIRVGRHPQGRQLVVGLNHPRQHQPLLGYLLENL